MNRQLDWDKIRIFHDVAEAGSFTRAGEALGLSQSAVSRQISSLEENLNATLFHRHARGLLLTEQGEILFRTAHEVVGKLAFAVALLKEGKDSPKGELTVTVPVGIGSSWLAPLIKDFTKIHPHIRVQLILEDRELDLGMREADVALRLRAPVQSDLIQRKLFTVHHHIFASPAYIQKHGAPKTPEDLDQHTIVIYGDRTALPNAAPVNWLTTLGRNGAAPRDAVLKVNNVYGILRAVESGLGIGALPDYLVKAHHALVPVLTDERSPTYDTYFVYPEELRNSSRITAFRDFLLQEIRDSAF